MQCWLLVPSICNPLVEANALVKNVLHMPRALDVNVDLGDTTWFSLSFFSTLLSGFPDSLSSSPSPSPSLLA